MEKVLITGANGLLGQKCVSLFSPDYEVLGIDIHDNSFTKNSKYVYQKSDITQRTALRKVVLPFFPKYIINTAAYTNVDASETNKEDCWKINVEGVSNLIYVASKINAKIVHISTDYIFDGENGPYKEDDTPKPLGYYGKSKLASENELLRCDLEFAIARTMVLYGAAVNVRPNFVTWLIDKLRDKEKVTIVDDQFGNPTLADDLAFAIKQIIEREKWDIFHVSGSELVDRYTFAIQIADIFKLDKNLITPIKTADLNQQAPRPLKSGFILDKLKEELNLEMPTNEQSLKTMKKQYRK
ncbi:dTDP-4-dehydrorhamnose reductase [candidate division KSB1 bacterium]|nr:dTDP-4-dehydrorhamnose reductase [candidate division KSB1 bacterium]